METNDFGIAEICRNHHVVLIDTSILTREQVPWEVRKIFGRNIKFCSKSDVPYTRTLTEIIRVHPNIYTHPLVIKEIKQGLNEISKPRKHPKKKSSKKFRIRQIITKGERFIKFRREEGELIRLLRERCLEIPREAYDNLYKQLCCLKVRHGLSESDYALLLTAIRCADSRGDTALLTNDVGILQAIESLKKFGLLYTLNIPHRFNLGGYSRLRSEDFLLDTFIRNHQASSASQTLSTATTYS